ncbi:SGNH/GDSL hydrolase family protein [Rubellicoccus peritrichatus]|uniref:SGNH/GDSL hydrolase family protein n=1 Tax=Rubellicoccus peritrichatus TaxID=3080537 RepID=A0AAQ3QUQ8_9BACT|nr:SGNH/GDSL hydrolase family protein [Puniceicoccus sp. CR14]WOO42646.1 SGNH/GDSL hydrolase family protein [Puniceicoccus sp. CR14]
MRIIKLLLLAAMTAMIPMAKADVPVFKKGDRVTFIGDSITHGGSYHSNLYLFYATRFPDESFVVYNCGISGDTAPGTNKRFEADVAAHEPNVATIMLGMNDAWGWCFSEGEPTEKMLKGRENAYETYTREMDQLAASLDEMGTKIIFIKPSIYDQTAQLEQENLIGKNDLLGRFSEYIDVLAEKYDGTIVDFYTLMNEVNQELQKEDPTATVVGRDRVHPGAQGHFVMSYAFLEAQDMPQLVSSVELDAASGKIVKLENCTIDPNAEISSNRIAFTCLENALPFPVTGGRIEALDWVPFQETFNQKILKIDNLKPGPYELTIDDISIGTYSSDELGKGINLSDNTATPQYQQALEVKAVNDQRLAAISKLRAIALTRYNMINKMDPPISEDDYEALKAALETQVEKSKGKPWYGYIKNQTKAYLESAPHEEELKTEEEEQMAEMWTINQPKPHRWIITPANK